MGGRGGFSMPFVALIAVAVTPKLLKITAQRDVSKECCYKVMKLPKRGARNGPNAVFQRSHRVLTVSLPCKNMNCLLWSAEVLSSYYYKSNSTSVVTKFHRRA